MSTRYEPQPTLATLLIDAQLPSLARVVASPLIQSANLENAWLAVANELMLQAVLTYASLAARDSQFTPDFEHVLAEYIGNAASSKALGGKFLEAILTGYTAATREREKGERE